MTAGALLAALAINAISLVRIVLVTIGASAEAVALAMTSIWPVRIVGAGNVSCGVAGVILTWRGN